MAEMYAGHGDHCVALWDQEGSLGVVLTPDQARAIGARLISQADASERQTCPSCGVDLRYPTAVHVLDCPKSGGSDRG